MFPILLGHWVAKRSSPLAKGALKIKSTQPRSKTCLVTLYCLSYDMGEGIQNSKNLDDAIGTWP